MNQTSPLLLLAFALAAGSVQAQSASPKPVSRDELRACMNTESELAVRRKAAEARKQQNSDEAAAIRAEQKEMAEEQKKIEEEGSEQKMNRFNRRIKEHNARVEAAKGNVEAFRKELESLNAGLIGYNEKCGGIAFLPEDKAAILKEREAAAK